MKRFTTRTIGAVAVLALLSAGTPALAGADDTPTTTTTTVTATTTTTANTAAWKAFRLSWRSYVDGLRAINLARQSADATARAALTAALSVATTPAERQAARAQYRVSIAAALSARDAAITAAGDPPTPPAGFNGTAYVEGFQAANVAYRAAVVAAQSAFAAAITAATTPQARVVARDQLKLAIAQAALVRANALTALGPPPSHPGK